MNIKEYRYKAYVNNGDRTIEICLPIYCPICNNGMDFTHDNDPHGNIVLEGGEEYKSHAIKQYNNVNVYFECSKCDSKLCIPAQSVIVTRRIRYEYGGIKDRK